MLKNNFKDLSLYIYYIMMKSIDEMMYLSDGINPFGVGIMFKLTPYNFRGVGSMNGGTIIDNNYIGLDKSELDKLSEDELRKSLKQNYGFYDILQEDEELSDEQKWVKKQIDKETKYIENRLDNIERDELVIDSIDEEKEAFNEVKESLKDFINLDKEELILLDANALYTGKYMTERERDELSEKINKRLREMINIKPIKRQAFSSKYEDEIKYELNKPNESSDIKIKVIEGSVNPLINNALDEIEKDIDIIKQIKGDDFIEQNFNTFLGDATENNILNHINFIKKIIKFNDDLYNTSDDKCKYYTKKLISRYEYFMNLNANNNGLDKNGKTKLDYMVVDFISDNACIELKTLSKSYDEYKKQTYINLVSNKITGDDGEFKPIYNNQTKKIKNIICEYSSGNFECLKTKELEYIVLFCLKDGNYIYKPLEDSNFIFYKDKKGFIRGRLNYDKIYNDYKIPIEKLIKIT